MVLSCESHLWAERDDTCTPVLVAILKRELKLDRSLTEILQILSVTPFEKIPIFQALSTFPAPNSNMCRRNQLQLFDL